MSTSLQEFLRKKTEGTNLLERNRLRSEWLDSLNRLIDQIRGWLREADPEEVLEVVPYVVERVEQRLGVYNAPALMIRLGTDTVEIAPSGRFAHIPLRFQTFLGMPGNRERWGDLSGGRVDIKFEVLQYLLFRSIEGGQDRWYAVLDENRVYAFDRERLEAILQDLLS